MLRKAVLPVHIKILLTESVFTCIPLPGESITHQISVTFRVARQYDRLLVGQLVHGDAVLPILIKVCLPSSSKVGVNELWLARVRSLGLLLRVVVVKYEVRE